MILSILPFEFLCVSFGGIAELGLIELIFCVDFSQNSKFMMKATNECVLKKTLIFELYTDLQKSH